MPSTPAGDEPKTPPEAERRAASLGDVSARGFRNGVVATAPFLLATAPFGAVFGMLAAETGLDLAQAMAMTAIVVAGASQLAALELMRDQAPIALVVLTGAVINLRMAMYSAAIAAHWRGAPFWARLLAAYCLHDKAFALSMRRYSEHPEEPIRDRVGFFFGVGFATTVVWIAAGWVGYTLAAAVPASWSIGFVAPLAFIAMVGPMIVGPAHGAAASAGVATSLVFAWLPYGLGVILGGAIGVVVGAMVERWIAARAAQAPTPTPPSGGGAARGGPPS